MKIACQVRQQLRFPRIDRWLAQHVQKTNIRTWAFQVIHWEKKCQFKAFEETEAVQMAGGCWEGLKGP